MNRGLFITLEGADGGGKTTQAALLEAALTARGIPVTRSREPGGDNVGERVRDLLLHSEMTSEAELLLFAAARAQNVATVIRPSLERGDIVICDRFTDSTIAYQGYGRGLSLDFIAALNRFATGGLKPDRTFLLDLPPSDAIARHPIDKRNRLDSAGLPFHERVRQGFLETAAQQPERFTILNGAEPVETVAAIILGHILPLLHSL